MSISREFHAFEARADEIVKSLVQGKPVRSVVTLLSVGASLLGLAEQSTDDSKSRFRGIGATKMGYLMPIIHLADPAFKGTSAYDALGAWGDEDEQSVEVARILYAYSEFCEVAPFIHRGSYCENSSETHVDVIWPTEGYGACESKDIIISNLSSPFALHDNRINLDWYAEKCAAPDSISLGEMFEKVKGMVPWFCEHYFELSPLSEDAMRAAVGVEVGTFIRFRAACMALAEFHTELIAAILRRSEAEEDDSFALSVQEEHLNLMAPCWKIDLTHRLISKLADIHLSDVDKLMAVYSRVAGTKDPRAEGFAPPFIASGDTYIFGPLVAQHMMSSRNLLYTCMKRDRKHFDDHVSMHLEPQLIATAMEILSRLHDVRLVPNIKWAAGEIDILVYRKAENAVLVIEAKAAVAPEGARMVERSEDRVSEALSQLQRFSDLPGTRKDEVLSVALGEAIKNVDVSMFVLTWASFGTEAVWSKFGAVAPLNISLLAELVQNNATTKLQAFGDLARELVSEVLTAAAPKWSPLTRKMGDLSFTSPVLEFNSDALTKYQTAPYRLLKRNSNWKV